MEKKKIKRCFSYVIKKNTMKNWLENFLILGFLRDKIKET